jgi:N-acetylglutamate synthase-like GNAT family acetyltransferase
LNNLKGYEDMQYKIRDKTSSDNALIIPCISLSWGSDRIITKGTIFNVSDLAGFVAVENNKIVGVGLYSISDNECEIVLIESYVRSVGIGSTLLKKIIGISKTNGNSRVFLITTNDNTDALKFYQKCDMTIKGIYCDSIKDERKLKPEIPLTGKYGIPIRDEIELEIVF